MKKRIYLFIIFCFISSRAQIIIHDNINIDDGLIYSMALSIYEDKAGYLWFGTHSGLSRWDGVNFENFLIPQRVSSNNCKWITGNNAGTLFIATRSEIVQYAKGHFSSIPETPEELRKGIYQVLMSQKESLYIAAEKGLWSYDGKKFLHIFPDSGKKECKTFALCENRNGEIFFAAEKNLIYRLTGNVSEPLPVNFPKQNLYFTALFYSNSEDLWIGTFNHGLFLYSEKRLYHFDKKNGIPSNRVTHIMQSSQGDIYISTDNGLAVYKDNHPYKIINDKNGLSNNFVWQVFEASGETCYIATDGGGIDIYHPGRFETINTLCGLPHNTVWTIEESKNGEFYFGTDRGIAVLGSKKIRVINKLSGLSDEMALCLHEAEDGKIYIGTNTGGVDVLDHGKIRNIGSRQGLDGPSVWAITEDAGGLIYFGAYDGGVNIWNGKTVIDTLNEKDGLPSHNITSAYRASDGSLYFGTDGGGGFRYRNGSIDSLFLEGNTVWSIYEDSRKNFYFGTNDNGLIYTRNGTTDTLNITNGLSHNSVLGILQDNENTFYLTLDNGMNIVSFEGDRIRIHAVGNRDGLAANECNQGAYFKDSRGYFWIGTVNGVSRLNPQKLKPPSTPPKIVLSRFRIFDREKPLKINGQNILKYNQNYLKFEYTGLDFSAPYTVKYRYRLSGIDRDWMETRQRNIQYTSLSPGEYFFEIMAGNDWDKWSSPLRYNFIIERPFWQRPWFIAAAFIVLIIMIAFPFIYRIRHLLAIDRLRQKIAADLHDNIGSGLSEINILTAVIEIKIPEEFRDKTRIEREKISRRVEELTNGMSDIVWLVNPKNDSLFDLISRLSDSSTELLQNKNIRFNTHNMEQLKKIHLSMENRQHLLLLFKEAINNSLKYSNADKIDLEIEIKKGGYRISVRDNGDGFPANKAERGNGLNNMRLRASELKGRLEIQTSPGKGTEIIFYGKL